MTFLSRYPFAFLALLLSASALTACGDDDPSTGGECVRDQALLDETRSCLADTDCPCGAHCELGLCESECRADAECSGALCDRYGRCGGGDVSPAPAAQVGPLRAMPQAPQLSADGTGQFYLAATSQPTGRVRLIADAALEVSCGGGAFASICELSNLDPGEVLSERIDIRLAPGVTATADAAQVRIFSVAGFQSVNVTLTPPGLDPPDDTNLCLSDPIPQGVYRGAARLVASVSRNSVGATPLEAFDDLLLPAAITVYGSGSSQRVVIEDAFGVITGPSGLTGESLVRDEGRVMDFAVTDFLAAGGVDGGVELGLEATATDVRCGASRLDLTLEALYPGTALSDSDPGLVWNLNLTRVGDLPVGATEPPLPEAWTPTLAVMDRVTTDFGVEADARLRLGDLGTDPAPRSQAALCNDAGATAQLLDEVASETLSRDLLCASAAEQAAYPMLSETVLAIAMTVESCLTEVDRLSGGTDDGSPNCVDAGRVAVALAEALGPDRARALGVGAEPDRVASTLGLRQIQQWLGVSGFMAREAERVDELNQIVDVAAQEAQSYTLADALDASLEASSLVLHPRVSVPLLSTPPDVLADPDYRLRLFPGLADTLNTTDTEDQNVGLPATMLGASTAQLQTMRTLLMDVQATRIELAEVSDLARRTMAQALAQTALGAAIYESTRRVGIPQWEAEWTQSRSTLASALERLLEDYAEAEAGRNPLGIEDGDLPLYRIGDQTGALARFSALSDFLVGDPGSTSAVAPAMVARAEAALGAAQGSWTAAAQRDVSAEFSELAQSRRIADVASQYGEPIVSLCGDPEWNSGSVLDDIEDIDPESCFVAASCKPTAASTLGSLSAGELGYTLCRLGAGRRAFGATTSSGNVEIDELADALPAAGSPLDLVAAEMIGDDIEITAEWNNVRRRFMLDDLRIDGPIPPAATSERLASMERACQDVRSQSQALRPRTAPSSCTTAQDCPVGTLCNAGACALPPSSDPRLTPECLHGSLGEMLLDLATARRDIEIARSEFAELSEAYDISMRTCIIVQNGNAEQQSALDDHNDTMGTLANAKFFVDAAAHIADAAAETAGGGVFGGAAHFAGAGLKIASDRLQLEMDNAERAHEATMMSLENSVEEETCFNDAELHLVGARTAALQIEQAQTNLTRIVLEFDNSKRELRRLVVEGRDALAAERDLRLPVVSGNFWLAESITEYERLLRQAQRAVYLSVLSVEYEFQLSSDERGETLAATTPAELLTVLDRLRTFSGTGTVGGASPASLVSVVSLREHLLQLAPRTGFPEEWQALSDAERFRALISSQRYAVYSNEGTYLGQEIPFSVAPIATGTLGEGNGITLLSGSDCAERLWSVNASIIGADVHTSDTSFSRIVLRKRNTFYSQWCGSAGPDGSQVQLASTRPSRNLFLDPLAYEDSMIPALPMPDGSGDDTAGFSNARIQARLNVSRADFETEAFADGDSQELAGRGLYGEYRVFLPAETLSSDGSEGLVVGNVEDILLRVDYVSVAR